MQTEWQYKQEWSKRFKDFLVQITVREEEDYTYAINNERIVLGKKYIWCMYVYIYPSHPMFDMFSDEDWKRGYAEITQQMPLHGGCTFLKIHKDSDGKRTCVQVGCDYNHYYDEGMGYDKEKNLEEAYGIERDALVLAEWMKDYGKQR